MAETKNKRKPIQLVKQSKSTTAAQQLTIANAAQSPLLRLSPELRNRIYKEALGGYDVHIGFQSSRHATGRPTHSICVAPPSDSGEGVFGDPDGDWKITLDPTGCYVGADGVTRVWDPDFVQAPLSLNLLQVCKQIHREAVVVPFVLNNFMFVRSTHLAKFSEHLIAPQRAALVSVSLDVSLRSGGQYYNLCKTDKARLSRLTGLRSVHLKVKVHTYSYAVTMHNPSVDRLPALLQRLQENIYWKSLTYVTVHIAQSIDRREIGGFSKTDTPELPEAYRTWAAEAEEKLLRSWSK